MVMFPNFFKNYMNQIMISTLTLHDMLAHHFHLMRGNNEFIYRRFVFQSVLIWNKLIQNIDIHVSYPRFKHLLKDFILSIVLLLDITISGLQILIIITILSFPLYLIQIAVIINYLYTIYVNYILGTSLS